MPRTPGSTELEPRAAAMEHEASADNIAILFAAGLSYEMIGGGHVQSS